MLVGLVRPRRRRGALALAKSMGRTRPWRVTAALCAFLRTLGRPHVPARHPPPRRSLRRVLVIEGAHQLERCLARLAILLGFHLGPPCGEMIFRVLGLPVTRLGWRDRDACPEWWSEGGALRAIGAALAGRGDRDNWPAVLYQGRRIAFSTAGRSTSWPTARAGRSSACRCRSAVSDRRWLAHTSPTYRRPLIPVLHHLDGRRHVVQIHAPLPAVDPDRPEDLRVWRDRLTDLVEDCIGRFPERCPHLVLVIDPTTGPAEGYPGRRSQPVREQELEPRHRGKA